jgi:murein L,D-transpeptidase YafK
VRRVPGRNLLIRLAFVLFLLPLVFAAPAPAPRPGPKADRIAIVKSARTMTLVSGGQVLKKYLVALGTAPAGAKQRQGDHKTPEGLYVINAKYPHSQFHMALQISYPNEADRARAWKAGVNPGGSILIYGIGEKYGWVGSRHREVDWTEGCVAVTNEEIEEIWKLVEVGTPVEIRP